MLSKPSNVSASDPPAPEVASVPGTQFVPFHFKTLPATGAEVVVSTSDSASIENAETIVKPSDVPFTLKKPPANPP